MLNARQRGLEMKFKAHILSVTLVKRIHTPHSGLRHNHRVPRGWSLLRCRALAAARASPRDAQLFSPVFGALGTHS